MKIIKSVGLRVGNNYVGGKGVKKSVVKKSIAHEDYKECLFTGKEQLRRMNVIISHKHEIYTEEVKNNYVG